jgi:hypothetical protein
LCVPPGAFSRFVEDTVLWEPPVGWIFDYLCVEPIPFHYLKVDFAAAARARTSHTLSIVIVGLALLVLKQILLQKATGATLQQLQSATQLRQPQRRRLYQRLPQLLTLTIQPQRLRLNKT